MSREINDETLKEFLLTQADDIQDFGYLIVPDDSRLNDEALSNLKRKFKEFIAV